MGFKTFKQADSRWGSKNYNGSSTMATAGCGPTSVAMLVYAINSKINPWIVAQYMRQNGYAIRNNGTAWSGIPAAMKHFGMEYVKSCSTMPETFSEAAKIGRCGILLFKAGTKGGITWTTAGHYVAFTDYEIRNGKHYFYTRDSGGRNHTGWYCYETQMQGLIAQIWVGKIPRKKGQYNHSLPVITIKKGDKGEDVEKLQEFLNWALNGAIGTPILPEKLKVDGKANKKTINALKLYQDVNHLPIDGEWGRKSRTKAKKIKMHSRRKAVNFWVAIARDDDFAYGTGSRAHHNGCYFCGTNVNGPKKAKKGSKWEKTYCCNTYAHAGYAHGAKIKSMLTSCKHKSAAGMVPSDWKKHGFKTVGKVKNVPYSKLKMGDVIIIDKGHHHVWGYTGSGWMVEATGGTFKASSIAHKKTAKKKYNSYKSYSTAYVMRRPI